MQNYSVYVVEDDPDIAELICHTLKKEKLQARRFSLAFEALEAIQKSPPNLLLLDIMLPDLSGFDFFKRLKQLQTPSIPTIVVSARSEEDEILRGLELGVEDYITKPFRPRVLMAKVKKLLSREYSTGTGAEKKLGALAISQRKRKIWIHKEEVDLTKTEFDILALLASQPEKAFNRSEIVDSVRGKNFSITERSIDFQIVGLRRKLGKERDLVQTVRGIGYRLKSL